MRLKLSYLACVFLMTRPFPNGTINFERVTLTVDPLTYFSKTLTLPPRTYTMPCGALPDFVSIIVYSIIGTKTKLVSFKTDCKIWQTDDRFFHCNITIKNGCPKQICTILTSQQNDVKKSESRAICYILGDRSLAHVHYKMAVKKAENNIDETWKNRLTKF